MSEPTVYSQPSPPLSPADEKTWAVLVHVGSIFFAWIAPLVGYLVLKDRGPFVRHHVIAALNFQLTMLLVYVIGIATSFFFIGILILLAASVLNLVFCILAAVAANNGEFYRYPLSIEFVH